MITPLPGATAAKPGSATRPFFGVQPALVDNDGQILTGATEGNLVILSQLARPNAPCTATTSVLQAYFSTFAGKYFSGDGARRDQDGYYWITGQWMM